MLKKLTQKRNKKGFTLVELVVVIAILGILAAIAIPRLGGFRNTAGVAADKATAATIGKAAELFIASPVTVDSPTGTKDKPTVADLVKADLIDGKAITAKSKEYEGEFQLKYDVTGYIGNPVVVSTGGKATNKQLYPDPETTTP